MVNLVYLEKTVIYQTLSYNRRKFSKVIEYLTKYYSGPKSQCQKTDKHKAVRVSIMTKQQKGTLGYQQFIKNC